MSKVINKLVRVYEDQKLESIEKLKELVLAEHSRQLNKWGVQERTSFEWMDYLTEELGELAEAISEKEYRSDDFSRPEYTRNIVEEAIQVATLSLKIAEMFMKEKEFNE